ncbi:MAG: hypothetical protein AAB538_01270, partial [Patescibacteria group bacterium]
SGESKSPSLDKGRIGGVLDSILQNLSLVLGISYYKLYVPPELVLESPLTPDQAKFWNLVYRKGLGEFWYRNNFDPTMFPGFPSEQRVLPAASPPSGARRQAFRATDGGPPQPSPAVHLNKALVGIGGGKDSIVAVELLKQEGIDVTGFVVETERGSAIVDAVIHALEIPALRIKRTLDPKLFEEHPGSYNGHVPISAMYAWLGLALAVASGHRWVVVGNEYSSNFGNLEYKGEVINHQWSKSAEFEQAFQEYVRAYITPETEYFSLLRPFHEIRITEQLTKLPIWEKVKTKFSSCNRNFLHHPPSHKAMADKPLWPAGRSFSGGWCGECPKCAFVFAMLAAFVPKDELVEIFGKNLFAEEQLFPLYNDLLGWGSLKPFDCVGTFEETQAAFALAAENGYENEPAVRWIVPKLPKTRVDDLLRAQRAETLPHRFRFAGVKNTLILGY